MLLCTKRFILRDFTENDIPAFVAYHEDPRSRELYGPGENTPEHAADLVKIFIGWAKESPRLNYQLAITLDEGILLGCCGLRMSDAGKNQAEFGIELDPAFWSRFGYATEIMAGMIDFGFNELGLNRIYGNTVSANTKISRLAAAFGADSSDRETPDWMSAKGWQQIQWQIDREKWLKRPKTRWSYGT
jgi:RimJ/RimL family protein N-acetyltransferase